MEQLFAAGGGGTTINPDNSMKGHSESGGQFGDHSVGLGGNWKSLLPIVLGAVAIVFIIKRH